MQQITQTKHATYTNATSKYANQQCKYTQYKTAHVCSKTSKTETHNHSNRHSINKTLTYKTTIIITHSQQTCTHIHPQQTCNTQMHSANKTCSTCMQKAFKTDTCKSIKHHTHMHATNTQISHAHF